MLFLHNILLLGTIQGFIISGLLFFTGPRHLHTRIFGWLMLLVTLNCLSQYLYEDQWVQANPLARLLADLIPLVLPMSFGPLILFYTRAYADPQFRISRKQRWHFAPVIIDLVPYLTAWIFIIGFFSGLVRSGPGPWGYFMDGWNHYADIPRWMSITSYLFYAWRMKKDIRWLKHFLSGFLIFQLIWLAYLIPYIIQPAWWNNIPWFPVFIPLVILIYWMGFNGFLQSRKGKQAAAKPAILPEQTVQEAIALLTSAMETDKLYLNPELNLSMLMQHTGLPQKTISAVLNQHLHKSFNEYINTYRIEAFKSRVREEDTSQLTIAGIAKECGFSSQATFQRIFKQQTGMVPSAYLKNTTHRWI
ncbi:helix-turn-helix domain-containing protein [Chitinophaga niabensis]|uniref:helix-turn-helix domain-containing protein n=1 Tax=Chitinophaga niabensis TaxID=536979 RepID=UPI0031BB79E5